jgi:hypothetical protein
MTRQIGRRKFLLGAGAAGAGGIVAGTPLPAGASASGAKGAGSARTVLAGTVTDVAAGEITIAARDGSSRVTTRVPPGGTALDVGDDATAMQIEGTIVTSPLYRTVSGTVTSAGEGSLTIAGTPYAVSDAAIVVDRRRGHVPMDRLVGRSAVALVRTGAPGRQPVVDRVLVT